MVVLTFTSLAIAELQKAIAVLGHTIPTATKPINLVGFMVKILNFGNEQLQERRKKLVLTAECGDGQLRITAHSQASPLGGYMRGLPLCPT